MELISALELWTGLQQTRPLEFRTCQFKLLTEADTNTYKHANKQTNHHTTYPCMYQTQLRNKGGMYEVKYKCQRRIAERPCLRIDYNAL
jgi:hypothetical protein